jgi:hypothetical protein
MAVDLKTSDPLHVIDVEEANGWYSISTDGHPKKLKTNREEGGSEAGRHKVERNLIQIQYAERNDKPNPHGGFYHDFYWYSAKEAEAPSPNGDDGITRVKATKPETSEGEAWRISLSVGSERAVQLAPSLQRDVDFEFIWALAYEFAQRIYLTPLPSRDALGPNAVPAGVGRSPGAYDDPAEPVGDDEDIPF